MLKKLNLNTLFEKNEGNNGFCEREIVLEIKKTSSFKDNIDLSYFLSSNFLLYSHTRQKSKIILDKSNEKTVRNTKKT